MKAESLVRVLLAVVLAGLASYGTGIPTTAVQVVSAASNLAPNPSFEEGETDPLGWEPIPGMGVKVWDATEAHSGQRSLKITVNATDPYGWSSWAIWRSDFVPVQSDHTYRLQDWIKTQNVATGAHIDVHYYNDQYQDIGDSDSDPLISGTQDWTYCDSYFVTPTDTSYVQILAGIWHTTAVDSTAWFDDVSLTCVDCLSTFELTISSTAGGNVTTPGEGTFAYAEGTVVNLTATPASGYQFANWTGDVGTIGDVNAPVTSITMNEDCSITANFAGTAPPPTQASVWSNVDTPSTQGWVLAPDSIIWDYSVTDGGEIAYAAVYSNVTGAFHLLKSADWAATWDDITDAVTDVLDGNDYINYLPRVATDHVAPDFVAITLDMWDDSDGVDEVHVFISTNGGATFIDTGEVEDGAVSFPDGFCVSDLAVSPEDDGIRDIALGGANSTSSLLFRCMVVGDLPGAWEDATEYGGWDDEGAFDSELVTDITFSPSWTADKTILVTTVSGSGPNYVYLQCGSWGTSEGWNQASTMGIQAVPIIENVDIPMSLSDLYARCIAGITVPSDYDSSSSDTRVLWLWVDYYDEYGYPACVIVRADNDVAYPIGPMGQIEDSALWLTNVSYYGTIAEGQAVAGVLGDGVGDYTQCCEGVQVYRNDSIVNMDICCQPWEEACKSPTGVTAMAVSYIGEDKAYAIGLGGLNEYNESAWSVTFDDGDTWNQLSLVDTDIDYLSDVAVSPDCNKTLLVSVNEESGCQCDSVWLRADTLPESEEYSGKWLRTWCGQLEGSDDDGHEHGILRLAPEETAGDTVYLADLGSGNVYRNDLETLACWGSIPSTVGTDIADLAALNADTIYVVGYGGDVALSDEYEWQEAVDSRVSKGWTIAVRGDHILVGGDDGEVSHSDDGGETFALLEDIPTIEGCVTVGFDTYFETNMTVYATTVGEDDTGGIYSWVIGGSEEWTDLHAVPLESQLGIDDGDGEDEPVEVAFTGLVVDGPGNPFTSPDNGGVIYASYYGYAYDESMGWVRLSGAARSLERDASVCTTCPRWDFLHTGLTIDVEGFEAWPDALKICGCLIPDTDTHLFALDQWSDYDMFQNEYGSIWTYEDCYAKKAPYIISPADGTVIPTDPSSCYSVPFTVLWEAICDACSFDIAFAMDEEFTIPAKVNGEEDVTCHIASDTPSFSVLGGPEGGLSCETTYYIRVRATDAATGETIHSWWSDPIAIRIAPSAEAAIIDLISPAPGAIDQPVRNVGFSWDLEAIADSFDWVLSENPDLSSPIASVSGIVDAGYTLPIGMTLAYGTTYYWQVAAYYEGAMICISAVGTFSTANFSGEIWNWYDLDGIRDNLDRNYVLMNDLDSTTAGYDELAGPTANGGKGWEPIGSEDLPFVGSYDGQGYEIGDLFINRPEQSNVGLVSVVDDGGVIKDVGVVNADVTGGEAVGILVGRNCADVSNSYSTGSVAGDWHFGGLVGRNWLGTVSNSYSICNVTGDYGAGGLVGGNFGSVDRSYSTGNVTGNHDVGGLVGTNSGPVVNSYSTGSVSGGVMVGGLAGWNEDNVSNSYSTGGVIGSSEVGGLVGGNAGTVTNCFWDTESSGQATSDGGTGKTTAEMMNPDTFSDASWNTIVVAPGVVFPSYAWNMIDGQTYPFLGWEQDRGAAASDSKTETVSENGTVDAKVEADTEVEVTGNATVTVSGLTENPGQDLPSGTNPLDKYIDVYVPDTDQVSEIEIRLYYTDAEVLAANLREASLKLLWWDGQAWVECSDTGVNTQDTADYSGYVWAKIRTNTIPTLSDLSGDYFTAGGLASPPHHPTPPSTPTIFPLSPPARYDLTIDSTGGGSVTTPTQGTHVYDAGTVVDLVAEAEAGYRFVSWTGNVDTIDKVDDAETTITMDADYSITANFVAQYDLTVGSTVGGSVTIPGGGTHVYDAGTVLDLVAEAEEGYRFVNWTGDVDTISNSNAIATTIIMHGNYSITANFIAQYHLTIRSTDGGEVVTPGEGTFTYDAGTIVDLVPKAEEDWQFTNWTGDVATIDDSETATTIIMDGDCSITADFRPMTRWLLIGGIIVAVVAAGLVGFLLMRRRRRAR